MAIWPPRTPSISTNSDCRQYKLVFIGNSGVGKSSIIMRICRNRFSSSSETTIGAAFLTHNIEYPVDDGMVNIKLKIWDTAGQERYRSMLPLYLRGANIIIIVYDLTDRQSFDNIKEYWLQSILQDTSSRSNILVYLVGNKSDAVTNASDLTYCTTEACDFIKEYSEIKIFHKLTSAKTGVGITELFDDICKNAINYITFDQNALSNSTIRLGDRPQNKYDSPCCSGEIEYITDILPSKIRDKMVN